MTVVSVPRSWLTLTAWILAYHIDWPWYRVARDEDDRRVALGIPSVFG